jgi:hypothetical protein
MGFKNYLKIGSLATFLLASTLYPIDLNQKKDLCPYPVRLEERIRHESEVKNNLPDKYAILVRGDDEQRHVANFSLSYQVLLENNYKPENIYILTDNGKEQFYHPVDDIASKESLLILLKHLSKKIDKKDTLLFYFNDHGVSESFSYPSAQKEITISKFYLKNKSINPLELDAYLSLIKPKIKILMFGFCKSGGFANWLGKENTIVISSSSLFEESYSETNKSFGGFFLKAFRKNSGADSNHDGFTSILEAYNYAKEKHYCCKINEQHPQLVYDKTQINPNKIGL